jgi:hypothetical protein
MAPSSRPAPAAPPEPRHGSDNDRIGTGLAPRPQPTRRGSGRARWRWRAAAVLASIVLVACLGGVALILARHGDSPKRQADSHTGTSQQLTTAASARTQAITWILQQVSRAAVVACDPQICADLAIRGFPSADLLREGPQSTDPLGADLVVATAAIRAQYGHRLASVYAPVIIASFGSGNARIDIRLEFPEGTVQYRAVERAALLSRKTADAELLSNSRIAFTGTARAQLRSGGIDPRLPLLIAAMAHAHPVEIVDFGDHSPGGGPASLLRSVDLAVVDSRAHLKRAAYLRWMYGFINVQRAQYRPAWNRQVTLRTGQTVLRIGYDAPSPLS